jgi:hypothetical protein
VALDGVGSLFIYNGSSWNSAVFPRRLAQQPLFESISCASSSKCVALGSLLSGSDRGKAVVETYSGKSVSVAVGKKVSGSMSNVECALASYCIVATGNHGATLGHFYLVDGAKWSAVGARIAGAVTSLSCPAEGKCFAASGHYLVPLRGKPILVDPGSKLTSVSCPTTEVCYAVDSSGNAIKVTP